MKLTDIAPAEEWESPYIRKVCDGDLTLYTYTQEAMYTPGAWDSAAVRAARGLITYKDEVIARPFDKFFNYGQPGAARVALGEPVTVSDKVDGSLAVLFYHPVAGEYRIATRGSFTSEQALHATKVLHEKYPDFKPVEGYTYLFEIVYPENRIVLDYGDTDDLILLNIRNIATGKYFPFAWGNWKGPKVEYVAFPTFESVLTSPPRENAEGFVVMTRRGEFLKVKQEDYLLKHKLVFGLSKKRIWEQMQETSLEDMLKAIPDEFHTQAMEWHAELEYDYHELDEQVWSNFMDLTHVWDDRKAFALEVKDHPFRAIMFRLLDRKPIDDMLYKYIEPKGQ